MEHLRTSKLILGVSASIYINACVHRGAQLISIAIIGFKFSYDSGSGDESPTDWTVGQDTYENQKW